MPIYKTLKLYPFSKTTEKPLGSANQRSTKQERKRIYSFCQ